MEFKYGIILELQSFETFYCLNSNRQGLVFKDSVQNFVVRRLHGCKENFQIDLKTLKYSHLQAFEQSCMIYSSYRRYDMYFVRIL